MKNGRSLALPWQAYVLGALILAGVYAMGITHPVNPQAIAESAPTAAPAEPAARPTVKPDRRAQRLVAQRYWKHAMAEIAILSGTASGIEVALKGDDVVNASRLSDKGERFAQMAAQSVQENVPTGWIDVKNSMYAAAISYQAVFHQLHAALDSEKPSDFAVAADNSEAALAYVVVAVHRARVQYAEMGGQPSDISDGVELAAAIRSLLEFAKER